MINRFEFEGTLVSILPADSVMGTSYLKLEGLTPMGYNTIPTIELNESLTRELERVNKYAKIAVGGHFETRSKEAVNGEKIRKRLYLVAEEIISIKDSKYEYD